MSVTGQDTKAIYDGDGTTVNFPFDFYLWEASDLLIYVNGVLQVIVTDYIITGTQDSAGGYPTGGNVQFTMGATPPAGNPGNVVLTRQTPKTQTTTYTDGAATTALSLNRALDKLTLMIQDLFAQYQGALPSDPIGPAEVGDWYFVQPPVPGGPWVRVCCVAGNPGTFYSAAFIGLV
jgi:hypothetical protein